MTEIEQYIKGYFGVSEDSLSQISKLFKPEKISKGYFHTKIGSYCNKLSFLTSGHIRVYNYKDGKDITQWISTPGYFVTELSSVLFDSPSRWNIQALTDCELSTISKTDYRNLEHQVPDWSRLEKLFIAKCFTTLENRVYSFLSMSAEERYKALHEDNSELFNVVPLHYIASMLGMTPETLSRIRKKSPS